MLKVSHGGSVEGGPQRVCCMWETEALLKVGHREIVKGGPECVLKVKRK
jgi:hypothetical protein